MKKILLALSLFISLVAHATPLRTMWVYDDVVTNSTTRSDMYTFASANGVTEIYLNASSLLANQSTALGSFIEDAYVNHGISTTLLFGEYNWALSANHYKAIAKAQATVNFVQALQAQSKPVPVRIQFDIEPHAIPEWDTDMNGTANQYLDLIASLKAVTSGVIELQMVIAYWYDGRQITRNSTTRAFSDWIIDASDSTAMMNYRDTGSKLISGAQTEINYAASVSKSIHVGVNTKCKPGDASYAPTTFCEEGKAAMLSALSTMETQFNSSSSYAGYAVFTYGYYKILAP